MRRSETNLSIESSPLALSPEMMSDQEFSALDQTQEEFVIRVSASFPLNPADERLKSYVSRKLGPNFIKGHTQFCAGGRLQGDDSKLISDFQEDFRLGNADTCAERFLMDQARQNGKIIRVMTTYRGEEMEVAPADDGLYKLQTLQTRGGKNHNSKNNAVMRHMVVPCAYCREGLCNHNKTSMVVMPPGILSPEKNSIKVPAFITYPEQDLFQKDDPLLRQLQVSGATDLVQARRQQKAFFVEIASEYPITEKDQDFYNRALEDVAKPPVTDKPFMLVRGITTIGEVVEVGDYVDLPEDPNDFNYLEYKRNLVETRFFHKMSGRPDGKEHSIHKATHPLRMFGEFYRPAGSTEVQMVLPNADSRQRIIERYNRSLIMHPIDGKLAQFPSLLLVPNRYKRFDKLGGRV